MSKVKEIEFQNYKIRHRDNKCMAFHKVYTQRLKKFEGLDCIQQAKKWITKYHEKRENWDNVKNSMISFNVDFLRDIMGELDSFSFNLFEKNDETFVEIFTNREKGNYKTIGKSNRKRVSLGSEWSGTANKVKSFNLFPNARYSLEEVKPNIFKIIFDSIIESSNDKYCLGIPGLMVYSKR